VARAPQGAPDHSVTAQNAAASGTHAQVITTKRVVECESNPNLLGSDFGRIFASKCRDDFGASTPGVDPSDSEGFPVTDCVCDGDVSVPGTDTSDIQGTPATSSSY
ncbi:hypothetical protein JG688_00002375, partial [Phytophthora aleatoria]